VLQSRTRSGAGDAEPDDFMETRRLRAWAPAPALAFVAALVAATVGSAGAQPARLRVDHATYGGLLEKYVSGAGLVDYAAWKADVADASRLKGYLALLGLVSPALLTDRGEQLAFWINAYNALTIDAVLHFHPLRSIKDKVSRIGGYNVWDDYPLRVGGRAYSLNQIEHDVLRPLGEQRIHFAIVCASLGCPTLRAEAYTGERLDAQLDDDTRDFFASPEHLRIDRETRTVFLSPILRWFRKDFGGTDAAVLAFVARYAPTEADRTFLATPGLGISYLPYDWSLNARSRP
jgi:hypothetical protein